MKRFLKYTFFGLVLGVIAFLTFAPAYVEKGRNPVADHDAYPVTDKAANLHETLIIGDWHADSLLWKRDIRKRANRGQVDIERLIEGNVALQMFTAVTKSPAGQNYNNNSADATDNITLLAMGQMWPKRTWNSLYQRALYQSEKLHKVAAKAPENLTIIRTKADLETALENRKNGARSVGGLLGIEGAHALEGDINNLDGLYDAGYRMIGLHHFFDNKLGGSLHGSGNKGLTEFGAQVVSKLAKGGYVIDLAHSSPQVVTDVLELTNVPIIISHTGINSVCTVKRNIPDDLMQRIAQTGGVIAIGYWKDVTCDDSPLGIAKTIKAAINILGVDHVSLGSDFDGSVGTAFDTSELSALTHALQSLDVPDDHIRKVMGLNMVRILRQRLPD